MSLFGSRDSMGIVDLNTFLFRKPRYFTISMITRGTPAPFGYMTMAHSNMGGAKIAKVIFPDEQYAEITIHCGEKIPKVDYAVLSGMLCQECLYKVLALGITGCICSIAGRVRN